MTDAPAPVPGRDRRRLTALGATPVLALVLGLAVAQPWAPGPEPEAVAEPVAAEPWPTGSIRHPRALQCGLPLPTIHELDESVPLRLVPRVLAGHVPHGTAAPEPDSSWLPFAGAALDRRGEYSVMVDLVNDSATTFEAALYGAIDAWGYPPSVVLVKDGMIVGAVDQLYLDLAYRSPESVTWAPGTIKTVGARSTVGDCGGPDAPLLEPDDYEAYVAVDLLTPVSPATDPLDTPLGGDYWMTLVGGPYPVAVTGEAPEPVPDPAGIDDVREGRLPTLDALQVSYDGLGPLYVGNEVPAEPTGTDLIRWDEVYCPSPDAGRWAPTQELGPTPVGDGPWFAVEVTEHTVPLLDGAHRIDHRITRIDTVGIVTDQGVGPGSTLAEIKAAYPV